MYSQETADKVCELLASGMSLRKAALAIGVPESKIRDWATRDVGGFSAQYTHARELGIYARQDELQEIVESATPENVAVVRLRFDHARWDFSKVLPKVFGEKLDMTSKGEQIGFTIADAVAIAKAKQRTEDSAK